MNNDENMVLTKYDLLFESRLTSVETTMKHVDDTLKEIKSDLRWMLNTMIAFSAILLGLMAKGFHWFAS